MVDYNKYTILMQNINNKGNSMWREKGCVWEISVLSAHVFCKPKMALQNKITNLNRIKREEKNESKESFKSSSSTTNCDFRQVK